MLVPSVLAMREVQADGSPLRTLCSGLDVHDGELSKFTVLHYLLVFSDESDLFRTHKKHSFFE